ncbi:MAG: AMP-binding protein [Actinomycetes bacterium]
MDWAATVGALVHRRAGDDRTGLMTHDRSWTWAEHTAEAAARAAWYAADRRKRDASGPPHVGVLMENVPEFSFWLAAAAVGRFVLVGLNPLRTGDALARDVRSTACDLVLADAASHARFDGLDLGGARVLDPSAVDYPAADLPANDAEAGDLYLLIFTSGTTADPKAVKCSQGKIALSGQGVAFRVDLTADDVTYVSMPMFHSNAVIAGWTPALATGSALALRPRFSASQFVPDVRKYGATYANYVGTPLSYVLAQPEQPDDADNPLRRLFGNEAAPADIERFAQRFGCQVQDGFGSTEGGISISRAPETPPGSLGLPNGDVRVLDPETGEELPRARFDDAGRLLNADEAVGELVGMDGPGLFEGYWNADEDDARRLRDGKYWSGDLGYRDEDGFLYFAGRGGDRLRVGGENFTAAPIARLLGRHPDVVEVAVYAVPDPVAGDQVMATVVPGDRFDPAGLIQWAALQPDAVPVQLPRFVRVTSDLPRTATGKLVVRALAQQRWDGDGVWVRDGDDLRLRPMTDEDRAELARAFEGSGRVLV